MVDFPVPMSGFRGGSYQVLPSEIFFCVLFVTSLGIIYGFVSDLHWVISSGHLEEAGM